jgi:hypothetical protein
MSDDITLHACWGNRKETVDECAKHAERFLRLLAEFDDTFGQWFKKGMSRRQALQSKVEPTFESLRNLLSKGRSRRDDNKEVIEDLGFHLALWNGLNGYNGGAGVYIHCGSYPDPTMHEPNFCDIDFPYGGSALNRLLQVDKLCKIIDIMVTCWNPDWAWVSTYDIRGIIYPGMYRGQAVGWLTYISNRYGALPALPKEYEITRINGFGSVIVITTIDRLTVSNPVHIEAMRRLSEILEKAGMLAPTPPSSSSTAGE